MDIEKSLSHTRNRERSENLKLFLARNRHGLEAIRCSTFYYAETNTSILFLVFSFSKTADDPLAILAVHEFKRVLAWNDGNAVVWEGDQDLVSFRFLLLNHSHEVGIHFQEIERECPIIGNCGLFNLGIDTVWLFSLERLLHLFANRGSGGFRRSMKLNIRYLDDLVFLPIFHDGGLEFELVIHIPILPKSALVLKNESYRQV
jgi:hypothetical protein